MCVSARVGMLITVVQPTDNRPMMINLRRKEAEDKEKKKMLSRAQANYSVCAAVAIKAILFYSTFFKIRELFKKENKRAS